MQPITARLLWACLLSPACALQVQSSGLSEAQESGTPSQAPPSGNSQATELSPVRAVTSDDELAAPPSEVIPTPEPELPPEPPPPPPPPPTPLCEQSHWPELGELHPNVPVQYVALRVRGESPTTLGTTQLAEWGSACIGADDPVNCEIARVNADANLVYETTVCDPVCKQFYLVTYGDGLLATWGNRAALRSLLGPIDTPAEAVLQAFFSVKDIDVSCAAADPGLVRAVRGGYEFPVRLRSEDRCPATLELAWVKVAADGRVTATPTGETAPNADACP